MNYKDSFSINGQEISINSPVYYIADVASNHDGDLQRAKDLIYLAKEAGADAVKFQHFLASKIVSDYGFKDLKGQLDHQANWKKSVYEVYEDCELNRSWTEELLATAKDADIHFFTTPYDHEALNSLDKYLPAYKIGSGDITWTQFIEEIAKKDKPVLLATGASTFEDTQRAVEAILKHNDRIAIMQCNTNYTGSTENFKYINLNVLKTFATMYPNMVLGLSDHSPGHSAVLGSIALGARVIEKHFTDDNDRVGPDHTFSMNPQSWREMVDRGLELQYALGDGIKRIEGNEQQTSVVQRRCVRLKKDMKENEIITHEHIESLRPAPAGSVEPHMIEQIINKKVTKNKVSGDALYLSDIGL